MEKKYFLGVVFIFFGYAITAVHKDPLWSRMKRWMKNPLQYIRSKEKAIIDNLYASKVAEVRVGNDLSIDEQSYRVKRTPKVKIALENLLNKELDDSSIPSIALVCSGGGYRAMLGSLGAFAVFEEIGLFDTFSYISALSGSTWALGVLMATGMTIAQTKKYICDQITRSFYRLSKREKNDIAHALLVKIAFQQPFSTIDLFGSLLASHLLRGHFGDDCQRVYLSDQTKTIENGDMPFPIYSAVDGRIVLHQQEVPWYEFTPYEIGSAYYAVFIPSWAYGRRFNKGESIDFAPEQSLGFNFGVFGSAFGAHLKATWEFVLKGLVPSQAIAIIERALLKNNVANARISWARICNFMAGMTTSDDIGKQKLLKLVDAGMEGNLPYVPVSGQREGRKQDLIIFLDFSKKLSIALEKAEAFARSKNIKFPMIDYTDIEKRTISVFQDALDPEVPTVIYMPCISDKALWNSKKHDPSYEKYSKLARFDIVQCIERGACKTTNFTYTRGQSAQVMNQMEFNIIANKEIIIDAIRKVASKKHQNSDESIAKGV